MTVDNRDLEINPPRERLREKGARYLGDEELIAVLIGTGYKGYNCIEVARKVLADIGGIGGLTHQGLGSLSRYDGMGAAKAARLMAAVELGLRLSESRIGSTFRFSCSKDIYARYNPRLSLLRQEVFLVIGLNNKNEVIREDVVAKGSVDECRVNPREVFRPLIAEACARMVALHNHPSGDSSPSPEDIALTQRLVEVGSLIGIPMLDHLVIGAGCYSSLRDMGIIRRA